MPPDPERRKRGEKRKEEERGKKKVLKVLGVQKEKIIDYKHSLKATFPIILQKTLKTDTYYRVKKKEKTA